MKSASCEKTNYVDSDSIQIQGKRNKIQKYLNEGYFVQVNRNGFWVLVKPAKVEVVLKNEDEARVFNIKEDVCNLYGKQRISKKLVETFFDEIGIGKIKFEMENGEYSIIRA